MTVNFKTRVKWKNPTVSVKDEEGNSYSARVGDTDSSMCEIHVSGLAGGMRYTFVLGGISPKSGKPTTVKGTFETPVFGDGEADEESTVPPEPDDEDNEETPTESSSESVTEPSETVPSQAQSEEETTEKGTEVTETEPLKTEPPKTESSETEPSEAASVEPSEAESE